MKISPPKLYRMEFEHDGEDVEDWDGGISYSLGLNRFSRTRLGVQFGAEIQGVPGIRARVVYRMMFELVEDSPEANDPERAFRAIATRLAPVAMYPFVREAFSSLAQKALLPHLVLPLQNVGLLWNPDEIEMEDPPVEVDGG